MALGLAESLRTLVTRKFAQARATQSLVFSETRAANLQSSTGCVFQLRFCPSLSKKPKDNELGGKSKESKIPKRDPFDNPATELFIGDIPASEPSHLLVLNKFPVIENHFILATKTNKPQTNLLEPSDLAASYACIKAWKEDVRNETEHSLFAFFNSGEHSGASQPHRHVQFLPIEDMTISSSKDWSPLINGMTSVVDGRRGLFCDPSLSVVHFATKIDSSLSEQALYEKYILLLEAALHASKNADPSSSLQNVDKIADDKVTTYSYNLAMTTQLMAILPRRKEAYTFPDLSSSSVSINGTILSGSMMVKEEPEWDKIRQYPSTLDDILAEIGFPSVATRNIQHSL